MKSFIKFVVEEKETYVIDGQAGGKGVNHEIEARSHDHAKKLFKQKMKDAGHKFSTVISVRTKAEAEEHKKKTDEFMKAREAKIAANQAERDKNKEYWDDRQREYDKQSYKGE